MRLAIDRCREGVGAGQAPFGCAIEVAGQLVACEHNTVVATLDSTAHAEVNAIRAGCRAVNDIYIEGGIAATTCEPCPMCMAALHWARVDTVYYGASIEDAVAAGFSELMLPAKHVLELGGSHVRLRGGVLREDCRSLFRDWNSRSDTRLY
ncbi:MAG: nucleoside deaminase [Pirellulaceae bacterium]|jgi:tRNA(Arg) A34 adenosine deaminase TadA|nr:nucleoside deaminase [Pirellulaceae bacterium]